MPVLDEPGKRHKRKVVLSVVLGLALVAVVVSVVLYRALDRATFGGAEWLMDWGRQAAAWDTVLGEPIAPSGVVVFRGDTIAEVMRRVRTTRLGAPTDSITILAGRWRRQIDDSTLLKAGALWGRVAAEATGEVRVLLDSIALPESTVQRRPAVALYLSGGLVDARMFWIVQPQ